MSETAVEVSGFVKRYGSFTAVKGISFRVRQGEIFGLLGPNGAGKTSTLETLEGLRPPDGGTLRVMGVDPAREQRKLYNLIGVQLQASGLPETMTPREAIGFFAAYHRVEPRCDLAERMGLGEKMDTQYQQLSTGQKRRLALALAVLHNPPVVFLDEPTAGLDVQSRAQLHELLVELQRNGTTMILATHDMAEAEKMADRVAILLKGEIVATGTPRELTATGSGLSKVSVCTDQATLLAEELTFPGVRQQRIDENYVIYYTTDIGATVGAIIDYVKTRNDPLIDLRVERPTLEERFLELTTVGRQ